MPSVLQENPSVQYNYDDYVAELKNRLQTAHLLAQERLLHAKEKNKEHYDKTSKPFSFQAGEKVLLYDETVGRG
jgi:hypothetical protein